MKSKMPTSRAKTAYGLLDEVKELILARPKRYDQERFIKRLNGTNGADFLKPSQAPACGTVGCVAGWVATLKRGDTFLYNETPGIAADILGLEPEQRSELFSGSALYCGSDTYTLKHGTARYAKAGAEHITRFQKKYAKQLKAKRV